MCGIGIQKLFMKADLLIVEMGNIKATRCMKMNGLTDGSKNESSLV